MEDAIGPTPGQWQRTRWAIVTALTGLTALFVVGDLSLGAVSVHWWADVGWTVSALAATIACLWVAGRLPPSDARAWRHFGYGCGSWFVGMLIWDYNELVAGVEVPFPALSDFFFLGWAAFFAAGLLAYRRGGEHLSLTVRQLSELGIIACVIAITLVLIFGHALQEEGVSTLYKATALAYPVLELAIFFFGMVYLSLYDWGPHRRVLALLLAGFAVQVFTNTIYAASLLGKTYAVGSYLDGFWVACFALFVWAAFERYALRMRGADDAAGPLQVRAAAEGGNLDVLIPIAGIVWLLIALVYFGQTLERIPYSYLVGFGLLLLLLMAVRELAARRYLLALAQERSVSEQNFRLLAENIDEVFWLATPSFSEFHYVSPAFERIWKRPRRQLFENPDLFLDVIHPDDRVAVRASFNQLKRGSSEMRYRIYRPDGQMRWIDHRCVPVRNEQDELYAVAGFALDITRQKGVEEELVLHRDHLEHLVQNRTRDLVRLQEEMLRKEKLAAVGQLTTTVSHELRNPLASMRPSLYVIQQRSDREDVRVQEAIARLGRSVDRCDHIIDEMLDFTRITQARLARQPFGHWLKAVLQDVTIPEPVRFELSDRVGGTELVFDPERLRRALVNVLENACQAMTDPEFLGGPHGDLVLGLEATMTETRIEILCHDRGPGIPPEIRDRIFEPLFSTKGFGVGLGLPIVRQIMQLHQGDIEIASRPEGGTRVILWWPRTLDPDGARPEQPSP